MRDTYKFGHWLHVYNQARGTNYRPSTTPAAVHTMFAQGMNGDKEYWHKALNQTH